MKKLSVAHLKLERKKLIYVYILWIVGLTSNGQLDALIFSNIWKKEARLGSFCFFSKTIVPRLNIKGHTFNLHEADFNNKFLLKLVCPPIAFKPFFSFKPRTVYFRRLKKYRWISEGLLIGLMISANVFIKKRREVAASPSDPLELEPKEKTAPKTSTSQSHSESDVNADASSVRCEGGLNSPNIPLLKGLSSISQSHHPSDFVKNEEKKERKSLSRPSTTCPSLNLAADDCPLKNYGESTPRSIYNEEGETLATAALRKRDVQSFASIIARTASLAYTPNRRGLLPVTLAIMLEERLDFLEMIWAKNSLCFEVMDNSGFTPLALAVTLQKIEMVHWLLNKNLSCARLDWQGNSLFELARLTKNLKLVNMVEDFFKTLTEQERKEITHHKGETALTAEILSGNEQGAHLLLQSKPWLVFRKNLFGETPLSLALDQNSSQELLDLISEKSGGAEIDLYFKDMNCPLSKALSTQNFPLAYWLIERAHHCVISTCCGQAIEALGQGLKDKRVIEVAEALFKKRNEESAFNGDYDENGDTPLTHAIRLGKVETFGGLLRVHPRLIHRPTAKGIHPLHLAVLMGQFPAMVDKILNASQSAHAYLASGQTALEIAIRLQNEGMVNAFLNFYESHPSPDDASFFLNLAAQMPHHSLRDRIVQCFEKSQSVGR